MAAFDLCWQRSVQIIGVVGGGRDPVRVLVGGNFGDVRFCCLLAVILGASGSAACWR